MDWVQIYSLAFIAFYLFVLGVIHGRRVDALYGWVFIGFIVLPFILNVWGMI